ncbi:tetratricopeptide repeat protein [Geobacter argillaceus]|uniref:Tetratricopeptide repeat protein n=1 Tax=Geobacter argillaceus TaxID=345631 RepID=A0A562VIA4_9BACT|nr:tetratricopeptide repeat protein [Geobacter argillaceus]TWJ17551.1 tetratricopeptide repeat protein [Geobacter argillaceus]
MQLNLFEDNRPGILLNIADEYLYAGDLDQAVSVYDQIVDEYPDNRPAAELGSLVKTWRDRLAAVDPPSCPPEQLASLRSALDQATHPPLWQTVMEFILGTLQQFPEPDAVYLPPRFHRGHLLMEQKRYAEAASAFQHALSVPDLAWGRFLVWQADALTMAGQGDDALLLYLQAFLDDPSTVDMASVRHAGIRKLHLHIGLGDDCIEEEDEVAWLPVVGWMNGLFPLPLHMLPDPAQMEDETTPVPRRWFDLLTRAEYLRTVNRDDREIVAVRRLMKRLNAALFQCYMDKISSSP